MSMKSWRSLTGSTGLKQPRRKHLPVYFIIVPGWGIREVTILNMNSRNWTIQDFMETHAKAGNPHYVQFRDFFNAHVFDLTSCQLILTGRRSGGYAATDSFRQGQMKLYDEQVKEAYEKAAKIQDLKPFHPHGWASRNCVEAMLAVLNTQGYDHAHFIECMKTYPELVLLDAKMLRVEEYLKLFVGKYNFRRTKNRLDVGRM